MSSELPKILRSLAGAGSALMLAGGGTAAAYYSLYNGNIVYYLYFILFVVEAGHRALVYNRLSGVGEKLVGEGTHFLIPWLERPIIYDVRTRPRTLTSLTGSRDLQMVNITCRVLSRPDERCLRDVYRSLGRDYDEKVLPSIINEVLKSVVAQYNASQLITQREVVSKSVRDQLVQRARDFNILLDDVSLTHVSFSPEYEKAVEAKQVAQQQAERSKYIVLKAKEEKKSTIIKAQGESEAARLIGSAIRDNPAFITLRRIDTAREIADILSKSQNRVMLNSDSLLISPGK
ncbi:prohibitin [Babesia ovis]|uniref:Prohibitin n=1 Tax=Babesia ovis TaxID=5869 RepID=A0A9W5TE88_BABOV|nr:prohibitin [Babesia ovis]